MPTSRGLKLALRHAPRLLRGLLKACAAAAGVVVIGVVVLVHCLDRPWVKRRIQALVAEKAGVAIDYGSARVSLLSGISIDDLVVFSPREVRAVAPEFVRVKHLSARWALSALLGHRAPIRDVRVEDLGATVVVDEHGRTTFDMIWPPSGAPSPPLSHRLSSLLGGRLPVARVAIEQASVALVDVDHGREVRRTTLSGLALDVTTTEGRGGTAADLRLGERAKPLDVDVRQRGGDTPGEARARVWVLATATPSRLLATVEASVVRQTFFRDARIDRALRAHLRLHFRPSAARTDAMFDLQLADGAASASDATLSIPDAGPPVVLGASGDVDVAHVLALVPAGLVPLALADGELHYRISNAVLARRPRLERGGFASVRGDVTKLRLRGEEPVRVASATFDVRAGPSTGGETIDATVALDGVDVPLHGGTAELDGVEIDADGRRAADGALDGTVRVGAATVATSGRAAALARGAQVTARLSDVRVDPDAPLAARGDVRLTAQLASLVLRARAARTIADGVTVHADTTLTGGAPYSAHVDAEARRVRETDRAGRALVDAPARVDLRAAAVVPDAKQPLASTGTGHLTASVGDLGATIDVKKEQRDALDFGLGVQAKTLAALRPVLPEAVASHAPLDRMAAKLDWHGHVERLSSALPVIREHAKLDVDRPAIGPAAASTIAVTLDTHGTSMRHDADVDVRARALALLGGAPVDEHVTASVKVDRPGRAVRVAVTTEGHGSLDVGVSASFDRARRAVAYDVHARASKLGPLAPFLSAVRGLDGIDWSNLAVAVSAKGELFGAVSDVGAEGQVRLAPDPSLTAAASGTVDVHVEHFALARGDVVVAVPSLGWHADLAATPVGRKLDGRLDVPSVHLAAGPHVLDVAGISDGLSGLVAGDLRSPDAGVSDHVTVRALQQDFAPAIPVGDVTLDLAARRDRDGVVHLRRLAVADGAGGSTLSVAGTIDLSGGRRTLALHGRLEQDLARLSRDASVFAGRGEATIGLRAESADLQVFLTRADVRLDGVDVHLPRAHVDVVHADGEVPIDLAVRLGRTGVTLIRDTHASPYSMLRFADQHPLLSRGSFLRVRSIDTPFASIAPLVANVRIDRNIIAMPQLEMGLRKGWVTGQCALDWEGANSTLELHVRATGVLSSHGEPFDGNAAVTISAGQRSIEGRAEILRIGKRHLLDLLDVEDPLHADASINRVRSALSFGYPKRVHLAFDHGFASARIELGGLGSLLSIGEIRGIPTGPLIDRALGAGSRSRRGHR